MKKSIGIIGGMGIVATAYTFNKIIQHAQNIYQAQYDEEYPEIFIHSLAFVGLDETGITDKTQVTQTLIKSAQKLEQQGANYIIIPCNSVHEYYQDIQSQISIPIIHIVKAMKEQIIDEGISCVGLLSSESTNTSGFYSNMLKKHNIQVLSVSQREQRLLNNIILNVMGGKQSITDQSVMKKIINRLYKAGAEAIILGCTELPVAWKDLSFHIPIYNSASVLAEAAVSFAYND
ncbi:amino acid racemase [Patescibacteria group bacterium]|nr:amino acid racemase [Patescibacteria group bacterium]MBU1721998.1 amino acid racemase [Patescibacteria group bacterium]MBU1901252.1 amino acid racemase [Patescibacteria group bacterium]